jgi:HprK-related kinase A
LIVADLSERELRQRLTGPGLRLRSGPVVTRISSPLRSVLDGVALHYADYPIGDSDGFADFHVRIAPPRNFRRWFKPQACFYFDGGSPFAPLPLDQGFPMLEWGLNWCVSAHCHQYLIFHAAAVERSRCALVLPAPPGSGKSTLTAGLVHRGWRLLSDELTLIDFASCRVVPLPRPVSLKNASIDLIRAFSASAAIGPVVHDTVKGSVAHMRAPTESVRRAEQLAAPRWIVFPRYAPGRAPEIVAMPKERGFMGMAEQSFNYTVHGRRGFELLAQVIDRCSCHALQYGDLDEAIAVLGGLADATPPAPRAVDSRDCAVVLTVSAGAEQ